ncbi:acyclic terpene utilization AtuA family protein [Geosporobacter ferrireducens]|uniref:ABC transporter substrate-binding protein n=1 Tax=Geosporobacter ferrireducens TaxID=1424294 RepID=A0A1D8GEP4_9FIRM|nr:acyclic terpene utilization AtuA family protein [Geosporobacter ferrireducens]AOT69375.1 ABC transporter substrate-binding protein [Geosporobacter ferrireducens]
MKTIRIGAGAGYAGDRLEPALEIMEKGSLDYIVFECLAERTIAIAQEQKLKDPGKGYNGLLEYRMNKVLPLCVEKKVKVITNMGAANPLAGAKAIKKIAEEKGIKGLKIAAVLGDNIFENIDKYLDYDVLELETKLETIKDQIVSANAYTGVDGIVEALENDADIIITGRVADPSLVLAPIMYAFGWNCDEYDKIGKGIMIGHLLECAGQITGGYFADPGYKDVDDLWNLGFPIAEISENGDVVITKVEKTGGNVTTATCKEQLIYEIHDPSTYITPDGIADYTNITMEQIEKDRVLVKGATGRPKTDTLKVSIGYKDCFIGEGEMSYGGTGAYDRAKLAGEIVEKRLKATGVKVEELRIDYIGINSLYRDQISDAMFHDRSLCKEIRLRVSGRTINRSDAVKIGNEVEALYTNGPAGGGGATLGVKEIVSIASIFIPRDDIQTQIHYEEV